MIKVAFCSSPLSSGHASRGIGGYTRSLLEALKKQDNIKIQEFSDLDEVKNADLVHFPFFDIFHQTLSFRKKFPTVVTIHDAIPLMFPTAYPPGIEGSLNLFLQKLSLKNIAAVITNSEASKAGIKKYLGVPADKIFPVAMAFAPYFRQIKDRKLLEDVRKEFSLPEQFALFTGSANFNKNLLRLTEGALKAGLDLVVVGKSFETRENLDHPELATFAEFLRKYLDNPKVHLLGFVESEDLVAITNLATVLLLPSLAEGFGFPILEAQACGTPVITSNLSPMKEVAGGGALLVDPYSAEDISKAILSIINHQSLIIKQSLIQNGLENVKKYSWEKTAKETIEVYAKVIGS